MSGHVSRRDWIFATFGGAAVAAAQEHAHGIVQGTAEPRLEFFDEAAAADVAAIASQILPSGDGPGAKEAGVIFFIDRALSTFDKDKQDVYRQGLPEFGEVRKKMFPGSAGIATLSNGEQLAFVRAIENTGFFEVLRVHTLLGFLGSPAYGGNRGKAGWKYIGFEDRMTWEPPFGYYDAELK